MIYRNWALFLEGNQQRRWKMLEKTQMLLFPPLNSWETEAQKDHLDPHPLQNLLQAWQPCLVFKIWVQFFNTIPLPRSLLHWSCWPSSEVPLPEQLPQRGFFFNPFIHISLLIFSRNHSSSSPGLPFGTATTNRILLITFSQREYLVPCLDNPRAAGNILLEMQHSGSDTLLLSLPGWEDRGWWGKKAIFILSSSPLPPDPTSLFLQSTWEQQQKERERIWDGCCAKNEVSLKGSLFRLKIFAGFVLQMWEKCWDVLEQPQAARKGNWDKDPVEFNEAFVISNAL